MARGMLKLALLLALALAVLFLVPAIAIGFEGPAPAHFGRLLAAPLPAPAATPSTMPSAPEPSADVPDALGPTLPPGTATYAPPQVDPTYAPDDGSDDSVTPGAFCSPAGSLGHHGGHLYTCKGPGRDRWRR